MSLRAGEWREQIDATDAAIIDEFQSGFPVSEQPFDTVGEQLGVSGETALERVTRLRDMGLFRRFGPVLNPPVIGSSTLAAVSVPESRFDEVAAVINDYRQVNHNYARDHEWNMWFVVTAGSRTKRNEIIAEIESRTGCTVLVLPMLTDYYIDLEFPVVNTDRFAREGSVEGTDASATRINEDAVVDLTDLDRRLLLEIQSGFPLTSTPYRDVAEAIDADADAVRTAIERLRANGCIKRIGCVVNHIATGFDSNCMVVWDVPDEQLDAVGQRAGTLPYVTLCYHRPRRPEQSWPYNLFTMIHGRDSEAVERQIDTLAADYIPFDHERLHSTETLKQTGARYDEIVGE